jgi:TctA family transporter
MFTTGIELFFGLFAGYVILNICIFLVMLPFQIARAVRVANLPRMIVYK